MAVKMATMHHSHFEISYVDSYQVLPSCLQRLSSSLLVYVLFQLSAELKS